MSNAIELHGVTKCYGPQRALDGVTLEVPSGVQGEVHVVVGDPDRPNDVDLKLPDPSICGAIARRVDPIEYRLPVAGVLQRAGRSVQHAQAVVQAQA